MNKEDFGEYLEKIKAWAATYLSLVMPDPEEQVKIDFNESLTTTQMQER
jgi:hypothetical protein